jgi:hypothetical protein
MTTMPRLAILGATVDVATDARGRGREIWHVQRPGSDVERLVERGSLTSRLFTVDFTTAAFARFVDRVLVPLAPDGVVASTVDDFRLAALANERLGQPAVPAAVLARFADETARREQVGRPGSDALYAALTFSRRGEHTLVAVTGVRPLSGPQRDRVGAELSRFLDVIGLPDGPVHTRFTLRGEVVTVVGSRYQGPQP